jgi:hypothetical protein
MPEDCYCKFVCVHLSLARRKVRIALLSQTTWHADDVRSAAKGGGGHVRQKVSCFVTFWICVILSENQSSAGSDLIFRLQSSQDMLCWFHCFSEEPEASSARCWSHILEVLNDNLQIGLDVNNLRSGHPLLGTYPIWVDAANTMNIHLDEKKATVLF